MRWSWRPTRPLARCPPFRPPRPCRRRRPPPPRGCRRLRRHCCQSRPFRPQARPAGVGARACAAPVDAVGGYLGRRGRLRCRVLVACVLGRAGRAAAAPARSARRYASLAAALPLRLAGRLGDGCGHLLARVAAEGLRDTRRNQLADTLPDVDAASVPGQRPSSGRVPIHYRALRPRRGRRHRGRSPVPACPCIRRGRVEALVGPPPGIHICIANSATHTELRSPVGRGGRRGRSDRHGGRAGAPGAAGRAWGQFETGRAGAPRRGRAKARAARSRRCGYSVGHHLLAST